MTVVNNSDHIPESYALDFEGVKRSLPREPEGTGKKRYVVNCSRECDWLDIHELLMKDGTLEDNIPSDRIDCPEIKEHSKLHATYLLTDAEAEDVRKHPKVLSVNIDYSAYPGTYQQNPKDLIQAVRWPNGAERYYRYHGSGYYMDSTSTDDINRGGYTVARLEQKADQWDASNDTVITSQVNFNGDGTDVDVIVCDTPYWMAHPEFQNNTGEVHPNGYVGGNLLKAGFHSSATSATTGTCDILDLVLDIPYYLDPEWFEADSTNRLTLRWDGTTVPVESVARNWWQNSSQRSTNAQGWGQVSSFSNSYSRAYNNGTPVAYPIDYVNNVHGTECMGQTYGKTMGWAYNANKISIACMGWYTPSFEETFDMQKIFHVNKPSNPTYGNKNPTVSSNSWGYRYTTGNPSGGSYYFRQGTSGYDQNGQPAGVPFGTGFPLTIRPNFTRHIGYIGDANRATGEMQSNSEMTAGDELIASGVIFVAAAGNSSQKLVNSDHPDYNNYVTQDSGNQNTPLSNATYTYGGKTFYMTTSRHGFPNQIGSYTDSATGKRVYPVLSIGALNDTYTGQTSRYSGTVYSNNLESKVNYSCCGEAVVCYAPGDGSLTTYGQQNNGSSNYLRQDSYTGLSMDAYDTNFGGTSSACPSAAGMIATRIQYNREWTSQDVKDWLENDCGELSATDFHQGTESTTAMTTNWDQMAGLEGGKRIVPWQALTYNELYPPQEVQNYPFTIKPGDGLTLSGVKIHYTS